MQIPRPRESQPAGDNFPKAIKRFMENLQRYRGGCGRDPIRGLRLPGWEHMGEDLDWLDALYPDKTSGP